MDDLPAQFSQIEPRPIVALAFKDAFFLRARVGAPIVTELKPRARNPKDASGKMRETRTERNVAQSGARCRSTRQSGDLSN